MRILGIVALGVLLAAASTADAAGCKSISDPAARLACFDSAPKIAAKKAAPKPPDEFSAAKAAMARKLTDPESARFDDLFKVQADSGEAVCGMVNSKNRMGGYVGATGFIYEKNLNRATLMFSGGNDPDYTGAAAAAYCVYCTDAGRGDRNIVDHCPSLIKSYRR
jgi:hypothetical protein